MIRLVSPTDSALVCFWFEGFGFGPFSLTTGIHTTEVELTAFGDYLEQGSQMFHEKDVDHLKLEGVVTYSPVIAAATSCPTESTPDQITVKFSDNSVIAFQHGWAAHGVTSFDYDPSQCNHYAVTQVSAQEYIIDKFSVSAVTPNRVNMLLRLRISLVKRISSKSVELSFSMDSYRGSCDTTGINWWMPQSYSAIQQSVVEFMKSNGELSTTSPSPWTAGCREFVSSSRLTPGQLWRMLMLQSQYFREGDPPSGVRHYGDLAMVAAEQINMVHTNMISFLHDLRDIRSCIPRLKSLKANLATLAGWKEASSLYLSQKYGTLPTISDIQSIVSAVTKYKAHRDLNGFVTCNASARCSSMTDNHFVTEEQHVKLAIDREDDVIDSLIEKFDSIGLFPDLKNIWDLIPYSFAIDWLVDVGGFLERVDSRQRLARLNIRYTTLSSKVTTNYTLHCSAAFPLVGELSKVRYHRWTTDHCPVPPMSLDLTLGDFDHWLESGALVLQRAK